MKIFVVACLLLVLGIAGYGYLIFLEKSEYRSVYANEISDFMLPLAGAVGKYANENHGEIPRSIPVSKIFEMADVGNDFSKSSGNSGCVMYWNASIQNVSNIRSKSIVAWLDCKKRSRYVAALICDEKGGFSSAILPRSEVIKLDKIAGNWSGI